MEQPILHTDALAVGYGSTVLIRGIALRVCPGEILVLIGPNGAGKSTILKTISRQLAPLGGTVCLQGRPLHSVAPAEAAKTMSILMTERIEPELMTCEDVVSAGRYPYTGRFGVLTAEDHAQMDAAMELVHVAGLRNQDFSRISDGQRQRVMLARAICQQPKVLILDEPTSFLDIRYKLELLQILKELANERKMAVILSLHELDLAQKVADRIVCVRGAEIDRCGTPDEIFSGGYIQRLYGVQPAQFNECYGSLELQAPSGAPQVFVIGGGGTGIPVYRSLQRRGIPFAAGVLHENDLDYPVAAALAAEVIAERPFEPVGEAAYERAAARMAGCSAVICTLSAFGTMNRRNEALCALARARGILKQEPVPPQE